MLLVGLVVLAAYGLSRSLPMRARALEAFLSVAAAAVICVALFEMDRLG